MKKLQIIQNEGNNRPVRINEGQEKGNNRNITTPRPIVQPAQQPALQPNQPSTRQTAKKD